MIGTTTLSKLQKKHYEEIVKMFSSTNVIMLSDKEYIRLRDIIDILSTLGYVCICELTSQYAIKQIGDFSDFDKWHEDRKREERKLSYKENSAVLKLEKCRNLLKQVRKCAII